MRGVRAEVHPSRERIDDVLAAAARAAAAELDRRGHRGGTVGAAVDRFLSWRDLVARLRLRGGPRHPPAPAAVVRAALAAAAAQHGAPWSVDGLERTARWLRRHGLETSDLQAAGGPEDRRGERLLALARVLATAEQRLAELGLSDPDAREAELGRGGHGLVLPGFDGVRVDGLVELHPARVRLLLALARALPVELVLPEIEGRRALAGPLLPAIRSFEQRGRDHRLDLVHRPIGPEAGPDRPGALARVLFADDPGAEADEAADAVQISLAVDAGQETEALARRVALAVERGTPPDRIAIGLRRPQDRAGPLVEALERRGVPARSRLGTCAADTAPVRWTLEAAELALSPTPGRDRLADLLSSPALGVPAALDAAAADAGRRAVRRALSRLPVPNPSVGDLVRHLQRAELPAAVLGQCLAVLDAMDRWAGRRGGLGPEGAISGAEAAARLRALALAGEVLVGPEPLGAFPGDPAPEPDAIARRAEDARADSRWGIDQLEATLEVLGTRAAQSSAPPAAQLDVVAGHLAGLRRPPGRPRAGAVEIADLRALAGRRFEIVALPFVVDGELPAALAPDLGLLERPDLERISARLGRRLDPEPPADDALWFVLAVEAAERALWVSYDRGGDAEARPSSFVAELRARCPGVVVERLAATPFSPVALARAPAELDVLSAALGDDAGLPPPILDRVEAERARAAGFGPPPRPSARVGHLSDDPVACAGLAALHRADRSQPISAGRLERIAECGLGYLLGDLLGLEEERPVGLGLTALDFGQIAHAVLEGTYRALDAEGLHRRPGHERVRRAAVLAAAEVERAAEALTAANPAHRRVFAADLDRLGRAVVRLVAEDVAHAEARGVALERVEVEIGFGRGRDDAAPLRIRAPSGPGEVWLSGRIDRLDHLADGSVEVLDYKSGSWSRVQRRLGKGGLLERDLQLAVYAAWARLERGHGGVVDGAYLSLARAQRTRRLSEAAQADFQAALGPLLDTDPAIRSAVRQGLPPARAPNLADRAWALIERARAGQLAPRCQHAKDCRSRGLCRFPDDVRIDWEELDEEAEP